MHFIQPMSWVQIDSVIRNRKLRRRRIAGDQDVSLEHAWGRSRQSTPSSGSSSTVQAIHLR